MNWYEVWTNIAAVIAVNPIISGVVGEDFRLAGDAAVKVPSLVALLVTDVEDEIYAPADWQFDIYAYSFNEVMAVEKELRRLLNQPLQVTLGDAEVTCEFVDGQLLRGPERDPYYRRLLEFRFTPVRSRYYRPPIAQES